MKPNEIRNSVILYWALCIVGAFLGPELHGVGNIFFILLITPIGWSLITGIGALNGYLFRRSKLSERTGIKLALLAISVLLFFSYIGFIVIGIKGII